MLIVTRHFGAAEAALSSANSNDFSAAKLELFHARISERESADDIKCFGENKI